MDLFENIHIGPIGARIAWEHNPDETPDDDEELDVTPPDLVKMLGFDPKQVKATDRKGYDPNQPRDPGGEGGGQWVKAGEGDDDTSAEELLRKAGPQKTVDELLAEFDDATKKKLEAARLRLLNVTSTDKTHKNANGTWTDERSRLHESIITKTFSKKNVEAATPRDGEPPRVLFMGGRGGSGKGTLLHSGKLGDFPDRAIKIDPDTIKGELPEYKGWNAAQVHEESGYIANRIDEFARSKRLNVVHDATMANGETIGRRITQFKKDGYAVEGHYVHAAPEVAARRAVKRFAQEENGRYVPLEYVLGSTRNEGNFDRIKPELDRYSIWDANEDGAPKMVAGKGMK